MKTFLVVSVIGTVLLNACDSVRRIDMVNNTQDTVRFLWTLNEDSLANNPFLISNSTDLLFTLAPPKTKTVRMSFGPGNWSVQEVGKLTGFLHSLQIISPQSRVRIDSLPQLREFLLARRKGIGGARIEIAVSQ